VIDRHKEFIDVVPILRLGGNKARQQFSLVRLHGRRNGLCPALTMDKYVYAARKETNACDPLVSTSTYQRRPLVTIES
jgi:hypothetical protein